jgi:class 3 adenylate cyclase
VAKSSNSKNLSLVDWAGNPRTPMAIVFTDIVDSTRLAHDLGDEAMRKVQEAHFGQSSRLIAAAVAVGSRASATAIWLCSRTSKPRSITG